MSGVAIVTGGGRGIGAATARLLGQRGYDVAISYVSNDHAAADVVRDIEAGGHRGLAVRADCGVESDILMLFETVDRELGTPTALVNNAGIVGEACRVDALDRETAGRVFAVNIVGAMLCAREALRRMSTAHGGGGGRIVNISSTATRLGSPGEWVHYAASKGAVDVFTGGLAREVATEGVRVNAVAPGTVDTDLHADAGMPDRTERRAPAIPMQRVALAQEVAQTVAWLVCDAPDYMSGAVIPVSGAA
jgi:NAD(P)-dependent dehydrogenase (short-subunit alcohol dehydrogenase family)